MKLFPNAQNNRIFLRFSGCLLAGTAVSAIVGLAVPHFPGWPAVGPAVLLLLVAIFVIPETMRRHQ